MRFFFYGTLMDPDVCQAVLGDRADALQVRPAQLTGYRRVRASCGDYPVLVRRAGSVVAGLLVEDLAYEALLAMANFEGKEYEPRKALVIDRKGRRLKAWLFLSTHTRLISGRIWDLHRWRHNSKRLLLRQLRRWMLVHGAEQLQSPDVRWHVRRQIRRLQSEFHRES